MARMWRIFLQIIGEIKFKYVEETRYETCGYYRYMRSRKINDKR